MLTTHGEYRELVWWMVLVTLAGMLALLFTSTTGGF
jgi:hypothetical protein